MVNDALLAEFLVSELSDLAQRITTTFDSSINLPDEELVEILKEGLTTILEERNNEDSQN